MTGPIKGNQKANSIYSLSGNHRRDSKELKENWFLMQRIYSNGLRFGFVFITKDSITKNKVKYFRFFQKKVVDSLQFYY